SIVIRNSEWAKWERVMSPEGQPAGNVLTEPRPGHADLAGMMKYDFTDARNVLERASARETAARTAAGAPRQAPPDETGHPGLGSHVQWDRKIDARLAYHLMSIQAIKGVEIGDGFAQSHMRGTEAHDEIFFEDGELRRHSDRAGGTEGGMTIGGTLRVHAAMKPLAT